MCDGIRLNVVSCATSFLTDSSDHQELPEEQQEVGHFIEHHDPAGGAEVTRGVSLANLGSRRNLVLQHKPDDVPHQKHESIFGRNAEVLPVNGDLEGEQTGVGGQ